MAAGAIPRIGSRLGPCFDPCQHRDCAAARDTATAVCSLCATAIGYETAYYRGEEGQSPWVHAICLETLIEQQRKTA